MYFEGNASSFYYSSTANKTFSQGALDNLSIVVEMYEKADVTNSLLARKTSVRRKVIDNLSDFSSIDEAIKYGIVFAAGEISGDLRAEIVGIGGTKDIQATIDTLNPNRLSNLNSSILPVSNLPDLAATISGSGGIVDLGATILPRVSSSTFNSFNDIAGNRYVPKLFLHDNNQYSVMLTQVDDFDTINLSITPDLSASIFPIASVDLQTTISGV